MLASPLQSALSPRRRGWILLVAIAATVMFSWTSISHLSKLVELQKLPPGMRELPQHDVALSMGGGRKTGQLGDASLAATTTAATTKSNSVVEKQEEEEVKWHAATETTNKTSPRTSTTTTNAATTSNRSSIIKPNTTTTTARTTTTRPRTTTTRRPPQAKNSSSTTATPTVCPNAVVMEHTDFWGDALVYGSANVVKSAAECCRQCAEYVSDAPPEDAQTCNVWVYCADEDLCGEHYRECWLKHLAHPDGTAPANAGFTVGWTTGIMSAPLDAAELEAAAAAAAAEADDRTYHVVISAQGPATHWQSRVHYYWYLKTRKQCQEQGKCDMGGFTRILHSGHADELMDEIPTFVAQTLPPEHPDHGYIVLNRPWAFVQWIQQVEIKEKYVLMSEPDHIWLKPMPNVMVGQRAAAFPFFYIEPSKAEYLPITRKFVGDISRKESENIAPIGSAPTMMTWDDLKRVAPLWFNLSIAIHTDAVAAKEWGWVQEMYAFTLSAYKAGLRNIGLHLKMMSQPPFDTELAPYYLLHYTYGNDYTKEGVFTPGKYGEWRFDKRTYSANPPPRKLGEPPAGMTNELVRHLIHAINEATEAIPGWDVYEKTGKAEEFWDGKSFL